MHSAHARYAAAAPPPTSDAELVKLHAALIDRAARRLAMRTGGAVAADDLWSAGALGLVDAARRFDPARDVRFETFAEHRIKGAMLDELRRMDHLPRRLRDRAEEVERARHKLAQTVQREPSAEEVAESMGATLEEVENVMGAVMPHVELLEGLTSPEAPADERLERGELARKLAAAVGELPQRTQVLLSLHYVEGLTYREIAKMLEVSEPRICQLHAEALERLRGMLAAEVASS